MKKIEFLNELKKYLWGLPEEEIKESLDCYAEIIDDRMEDGDDEETVIADLGFPYEIAGKIRSEKTQLMLEKAAAEASKKRLSAGVIVLLALGSPLWITLLLAALSVLIAVYAVMWSVIVCLWSAVAALGAGGLAGVLFLPKYLLMGELGSGVALFGAGLLSGGLAILAFLGCLYATKGMAIASKYIFFGCVSLFGGRRKAR